MAVSARKVAGEVLEVIPLVTRRVAADFRKSERSMKLAYVGLLGMVARNPRSLGKLSDFHAVSMPTMSKTITTIETLGWVAVGATRQEILWQFLVESALLTLLGGASGLAIGAALAEGVAAYTPIPATIPLWAIITALAMAIVTGVLFGIAPAYRASRLDPIAALRFE